MVQMTKRSALALLAVACVAVIVLHGCDGSGDVTPPSGTSQVMMMFDTPASQLSELYVRMTRVILTNRSLASVHERSAGTWVLQPVVSGTVLPANPQFGTLRGTVSEPGGAPLQVPPGLRAAVFLEMPAGPREVQSIAELESDGSFSFPRVPGRQRALVVRVAEADWSPVGDPLLQEFGAGDVARRPVRVNADSTTVVNTTVVR